MFDLFDLDSSTDSDRESGKKPCRHLETETIEVNEDEGTFTYVCTVCGHQGLARFSAPKQNFGI